MKFSHIRLDKGQSHRRSDQIACRSVENCTETANNVNTHRTSTGSHDASRESDSIHNGLMPKINAEVCFIAAAAIKKKIGVNAESFARHLRDLSWRHLRKWVKFSQCVQTKSKVTQSLLPKSRNCVIDMYKVCTYPVFTKIQRLCIFSQNQKNTVPTHCILSVDCVFGSVFETMYRLCST